MSGPVASGFVGAGLAFLAGITVAGLAVTLGVPQLLAALAGAWTALGCYQFGARLVGDGS